LAPWAIHRALYDGKVIMSIVTLQIVFEQVVKNAQTEGVDLFGVNSAGFRHELDSKLACAKPAHVASKIGQTLYVWRIVCSVLKDRAGRTVLQNCGSVRRQLYPGVLENIGIVVL
jgi:hypothetical protein